MTVVSDDSSVSRSPARGAAETQEDGAPPASVITFGPYCLRKDIRRLEREGVPVQLGDRAFDILCALTERAGQIVTNRELMARVWGSVVVGAGSLRFHINVLRRALAQDATRTQYIKNVTRRGYAFLAPVSKVPPGQPLGAWVRPGTLAIRDLARLLEESGFRTLMPAIETLGERLPESVALIAIVLARVAVK